MSHNTLFVLALILFDGVAVAFGVWQYMDARPDKGAKPDEPSALSRSAPKSPRHPEG